MVLNMPKVKYLYYAIAGYYIEETNEIILPYYYATPMERAILLVHEMVHWIAHFLPEEIQDMVDSILDGGEIV